MNATQLKAAIRDLDRRIPGLEELRDKLTRARRAVLASDDERYPEDIIRTIENGATAAMGIPLPRNLEARTLLADWRGEGLRPVEEQLASMVERRELLVAKLPSEAEVADAAAKVAERVEAMHAAEMQFGEAWAALVQALDGVKVCATTLSESRSLMLRHGTEAGRLAEEFGVEAEGVPPTAPVPPAEEQRLASLLVDVARQAVDGQHVDSSALGRAEKAASAAQPASKVAA